MFASPPGVVAATTLPGKFGMRQRRLGMLLLLCMTGGVNSLFGSSWLKRGGITQVRASSMVPVTATTATMVPLPLSTYTPPTAHRLEDEERVYVNPLKEVMPNRYRTTDWLHVMKTTPTSEVLQRIFSPIITTMVLSAFVSVLYALFPQVPTFSFKPHSLVGSALSLLLVFRTNTARS